MTSALRQRFQSKVDTTSGCWMWTGALTKGYGCLKHEGKAIKAHRLSYELHVGPIPAGMHVLHRCDVPGCVNPDHLFLGSHLDNMRDMYAKKRRTPAVGEANGRAKLTRLDVASIRADGQSTISSMARQFGVSRTQIRNVQRFTNFQ